MKKGESMLTIGLQEVEEGRQYAKHWVTWGWRTESMLMICNRAVKQMSDRTAATNNAGGTKFSKKLYD